MIRALVVSAGILATMAACFMCGASGLLPAWLLAGVFVAELATWREQNGSPIPPWLACAVACFVIWGVLGWLGLRWHVLAPAPHIL